MVVLVFCTFDDCGFFLLRFKISLDFSKMEIGCEEVSVDFYSNNSSHL